MISPNYKDHTSFKKEKYIYLRGRAGAAGKRSMMTDRGGTGKAGRFRRTVCEACTAGGCGGRSRRISGGGCGRGGACCLMRRGGGGGGCGGRTSLIMSGYKNTVVIKIKQNNKILSLTPGGGIGGG
jgi:hypothetical protein